MKADKNIKILHKTIKEVSGKNANDFSVVEWREVGVAESIAFYIALPKLSIAQTLQRLSYMKICEFKKYEFYD